MKKGIIILLTTLLTIVTALFILTVSSAATGRNEKEVVTFTKDVAPIFFKSCVECHRPGEAAPMSLLSYKDARPWAKSIREKVLNREMPPWHADPHYGEFKNDRRLTAAEIATITAWVERGAQEGDPRDLPPAPMFVEGWGIGRPDLVMQMPEEFVLEAAGPDEYQYFTIPTNFTEDRYIQAIEARPGNRKIVHHIVAFIQPPPPPDAPQLTKEEAEKLRAQAEKETIFYQDGFLQRVKSDAPVYNDGCQLPNGGSGRERDGVKRFATRSVLTVYAPGRDVDVWEPGTVKLIPAGSKILLQVHYSKVAGSVQKDRSSLGMIFAKDNSQDRLSKLRTTELINNTYFQIPPGAENHRTTACWMAPKDLLLTSIMPHMHLRGKAMEVKAVYPDGRAAVLLNVPKYDFSWQTNFSLKQPLVIPKGTRLLVTGYFDNSTKNRYNPDPSKAIRWGEPTSDEMLACFIEYTQDADGQAVKQVSAQKGQDSK